MSKTLARFSPVLGAGGHVEAPAAPVHPARLARADRGLAPRHHGLPQAEVEQGLYPEPSFIVLNISRIKHLTWKRSNRSILGPI